jgi:hypothetical protein
LVEGALLAEQLRVQRHRDHQVLRLDRRLASLYLPLHTLSCSLFFFTCPFTPCHALFFLHLPLHTLSCSLSPAPSHPVMLCFTDALRARAAAAQGGHSSGSSSSSTQYMQAPQRGMSTTSTSTPPREARLCREETTRGSQQTPLKSTCDPPQQERARAEEQGTMCVQWACRGRGGAWRLGGKRR